MIDIPDNERRRAFSIWLRTGRLPSVRNAEGIELKFNPWHDPETGRFTFVGAGRHYGQWGGGGFPGGGGGKGGGGGATGSGDWPARSSRPKSQNPASRATPKDPARTVSPGNHAASSKSSAHKPLKAHGPVADLSEVAVVASVEQERQERGDHPIRNVVQPIHKARQPPLYLRIAFPRRTELPPRDLQARRANSSARSFAMAMPIKSTRAGGRGAFPVH